MTNNGHVPPPQAPSSALPNTAIAVVLDETGSMQSCRDAAISGFNEWLLAQQKVEGPCTLTLVQFSDKATAPMCRLRYDGIPIGEVSPLDHQTYRPDGNTPLYDAVGRTIVAMDRLSPEPDRILVVILTDGLENASREYTQRQIQDMIRAREASGRWTFVYLGANQDVWAASEAIGIQTGNAMPFQVGEIRATFGVAEEATRLYRASRSSASRDFWQTGMPPEDPNAPR